MSICKEKPVNLPSLEAIGLEHHDQHAMGRTSSGRRGMSGGMPSGLRQASGVALCIGSLNGPGKSSFGFTGGMGNFFALDKRSCVRSTSLSGGPGGFGIASGRFSPMVRSSNQGGPGGMGSGPLDSMRSRSKRGEPRNDSNRTNTTAQLNAAAAAVAAANLESVAPLEVSANRWVAGSTKRGGPAVEQDTPEVDDRKVRSLLNKLTMEKFESISNQIITWANQSDHEEDGRTLIQVISLAFEKATDEAT